MTSLHQRQAIALAIFACAAPALLNGYYLERLYRAEPVLFWVADFVQFVAIPVVAVLVLRYRASLPPAEYGFRRFAANLSTLDRVALILFACFLYWATEEPVRAASYQLFGPSPASFSYKRVVPDDPGLRLLVSTYMALTAALVEEMVYRGLPWLYVMQFRKSRYTVPGYVLGTSLVFAAIHSEQGVVGMLPAFSVGVATALLYVKAQNLWPLVTAHFLVDMRIFS